MEEENNINYSQFAEHSQTVAEDPLQASYHIWGMQQNTDVVFDFLMGERGFFWDKNEKKYKKFQGQESNFNEQGLKDLYNIMHSVVNRSNVLGNLTDTQINSIMFRTMTTVVKNMTRNKKRWELKEYSRDSIVENIKNQMLIFLSKTKKGAASIQFFGSGNIQESIKHDDSFDQANGIGGLGR